LAEVEPVFQRRVAFGLVAAGVLLLVVFFSALPRIHGFEHTCDPGSSARRLAGDGWWAIRGAQLSDVEPIYDAANRTTLVAPGCSHGDAGILVRVLGDHRGFDDDGETLVLSGTGVTGATGSTLEVERRWGQGNKTYQVLDGTFTARSHVPHALLQGSALLAAAAGVGLLRASQPLALRRLPMGAAAGLGLAHVGLAANLGLVLFLLVAPLMAFVTLGALVGTVTEWRRKWWFWAGGLAFAVAWWMTFTSFLGAYPLSPGA
jgi:hypothetical protein